MIQLQSNLVHGDTKLTWRLVCVQPIIETGCRSIPHPIDVTLEMKCGRNEASKIMTRSRAPVKADLLHPLLLFTCTR